MSDRRKARSANARLQRAVRAMIDAGFTVSFVDYVESAATPGLLGMYRGATNHEHRTVRIATKGRSRLQQADTAEHELHHVTDPRWDCGSRDVLGLDTRPTGGDDHAA